MKEPAATAIDLLLFAALLLPAAHLRGSPFSHLRRALCLLVLFFSLTSNALFCLAARTWYLRMSASETERRAYFMASSKCARVMEGTGSGASSSMLSGFSALTRSRSMSFSMFSRIAYLRGDTNHYTTNHNFGTQHITQPHTGAERSNGASPSGRHIPHIRLTLRENETAETQISMLLH
jgi:hypothetical protein